jgi:hypothetical protein
MTRQLSGQIRTALGGGKQSTADVWETATSDYDESPECAWCPICRARRRLRESGPGLSSGVAAAADAVGVVMQDAMSAFEAAVAAAGRQARPRDTTAPPPDEVWDEATDEPAVRTRPPANGGPARPTAAKPPSSTGPKRSSTGPKKPSAGPKQPPARPTGSAADTGTPPSKPNSDKPNSDKPTPDEPAS